MSPLTPADPLLHPARHVTIRHDQPFHGDPAWPGRAHVFTNLSGDWEETHEVAPEVIVRLLDQGFLIEKRTQYITPDQHLITEWRLCGV